MKLTSSDLMIGMGGSRLVWAERNSIIHLNLFFYEDNLPLSIPSIRLELDSSNFTLAYCFFISPTLYLVLLLSVDLLGFQP